MTILLARRILMIEDMIHNRSTIALLEKLGLSKNEIKCYLALLSIGSNKISEVAKVAGVNRVNAYGAVKNLTEHGLVEQEMVGKVRCISPAPLDHLQRLAQDHQDQATRYRWKIENLIPVLAALNAGAGIKPASMGDVLFFRGEDAFYQIADRTLNAPRGTVVCFLETYDYFRTASKLGYDDDYYVPHRLVQGLSAHVLHPDNKYARQLREGDKKFNRETRLLSADLATKLPCSIYIYGEEVAFLWTSERVIGVVIKNSPIVGVMKILFDFAWETAGNS